MKKVKQPEIKPYIATPMYAGMCMGVYTVSMLKFQNFMISNGIKFNYMFRFNESLIQRARNALTHNFLSSDCTHLLFIDGDIGFNADEVWHMLKQDKDVICGIYPSKAVNWPAVGQAARSGAPDDMLRYAAATWVVNFKDYEAGATVAEDKPFEIYNGGTGLMAIKRSVFEKLKPVTPHYLVNEADELMAKFKGGKVGNYFDVTIDDEFGVLLSEDYHFCKEWRKIGGSIWAAPWVNLKHVGTYTFEGRPERNK